MKETGKEEMMLENNQSQLYFPSKKELSVEHLRVSEKSIWRTFLKTVTGVQEFKSLFVYVLVLILEKASYAQ